MPDDERDDQPGPGGEGFLTDLLRQSTMTGTKDDEPEPPDEPPDPNRGTTEKDEPDADES